MGQRTRVLEIDNRIVLDSWRANNKVGQLLNAFLILIGFETQKLLFLLYV